MQLIRSTTYWFDLVIGIVPELHSFMFSSLEWKLYSSSISLKCGLGATHRGKEMRGAWRLSPSLWQQNPWLTCTWIFARSAVSHLQKNAVFSSSPTQGCCLRNLAKSLDHCLLPFRNKMLNFSTLKPWGGTEKLGNFSSRNNEVTQALGEAISLTSILRLTPAPNTHWMLNSLLSWHL